MRTSALPLKQWGFQPNKEEDIASALSTFIVWKRYQQKTMSEKDVMWNHNLRFTMVQTRSQTRAGAPAPPSLWPQRVRPAEIPWRPTLVNILTTRGGTQPFIPVLKSLYRYLNAVDLEVFLQAFPFLRGALQDPRAPVPSFRCQDRPPLPCIKRRDPASMWRLKVQSGVGMRQPCSIPGHYMVPHRKCEGPRLGYHNHGENFWVCVHCVRQAWERYSLAVKPICYDLCSYCSQNYRRAHRIAALHQCLCQWEHRDAGLHLCTDCRITRSSQENDVDYGILRGYNSNMDPIHLPVMPFFLGPVPQPTRIADFIDERGAFGESTCICGRDVTAKIDSYQLPPLAGLPTVFDFSGLVRICSHCRKEKFVTVDCPF